VMSQMSQKLTWRKVSAMSALGISGHSGPSIAMSALPPKQAFLSGSAMSALCQ
jgi:hypothetical protein